MWWRYFKWILIIGLGSFCLPICVHAYQCDLGEVLSEEEQREILSKLRISNAGKKLLNEFNNKYENLKNLSIQWDSVSYSQINPTQTHSDTRSLATSEPKVCVHLAHDLPEIEHVADLAHELVHATKLDEKILMGEVSTSTEFVDKRISAPGGEAEAFATECLVKREILGKWDELCIPYVKADVSTETALNHIDFELVVANLYSGELAASLTGESYPVMLAHQFARHIKKKGEHSSSTKKSALVNQ